MTSTKPVVLDVDTGIDDACALLLAALHPGLDLRAVSCVGGNAPLDQVVSNTLAVLHTAGRDDVPVGAGAVRPLLAEPVDARHVHGDDGMGDLGWPRSPRTADERHAVELLRDVLRDAAARGEKVTVVPLAPLTNIALLLRTYPDVAAGIAEICFMGGAANVGNATASAEFNVFHDRGGGHRHAARLDISRGGRPDSSMPRPREQARRHDPGVPRVSARLFSRRPGLSGTIGAPGRVRVIDPDRLDHGVPVRIELGGTWSRGLSHAD